MNGLPFLGGGGSVKRKFLLIKVGSTAEILFGDLRLQYIYINLACRNLDCINLGVFE